MKYVINLGRELGSNTYDFLFVKSFDGADEFKKAKTQLVKTFQRLFLLVKEEIVVKDDFTICYISFKEN